MGAIVPTDFRLGGKTITDRNKLKQVLQILNIQDPNAKLPVGGQCRYILMLEVQAKVPKDCTPPSAPKRPRRKKS
jgi:hypothetical protein